VVVAELSDQRRLVLVVQLLAGLGVLVLVPAGELLLEVVDTAFLGLELLA